MPLLLRFIVLLLGLAGFLPDASAFSRKAACTVRFHVEVDANTTDPFTRPVRVTNPPRQIYVESSSVLSERHIEAVYTYPATDGTWAALFKLDTSGRKILSQISSANRGRALVVFVGNDKFARQLPEDLLIDQVILDGLLPIPRGLAYKEALLFQKHFKPLSPVGKNPASAQ